MWTVGYLAGDPVGFTQAVLCKRAGISCGQTQAVDVRHTTVFYGEQFAEPLKLGIGRLKFSVVIS